MQNSQRPSDTPHAHPIIYTVPGVHKIRAAAAVKLIHRCCAAHVTNIKYKRIIAPRVFVSLENKSVLTAVVHTVGGTRAGGREGLITFTHQWQRLKAHTSQDSTYDIGLKKKSTTVVKKRYKKSIRVQIKDKQSVEDTWCW